MNKNRFNLYQLNITIDNFIIGVPVGIAGICLMASTLKLRNLILKK